MFEDYNSRMCCMKSCRCPRRHVAWTHGGRLAGTQASIKLEKNTKPELGEQGRT